MEQEMNKTILITGAGSGIGEGVAIRMAKAGHSVIAGVEIFPQVTELRRKAEELELKSLRVVKLDVRDPVDVQAVLKLDFDVLHNHAGIGEGGPVSEMPIDLVRKNYEVNVFAPLALTQRVVRKWIRNNTKGKIVFTSSVVGLITPDGMGCYSSTKHALEAIAQAMRGELSPHGIKVQVINPGAFRTGFNERIGESALEWLDDEVNFTKRADVTKDFQAISSIEMDPTVAIEEMAAIIPVTSGRFRNIVPPSNVSLIRQTEEQVWAATI
jgi:NAD(P)-dependent dehydrogenase (short-subunit alcohol dehydrogenase family)